MSFCPVWGFEGVYDINLTGLIKKSSDGSYIDTYKARTGKCACLRHPKGYGRVLRANLSDIWTSTFLGDKALSLHSYMDSINR